MFEKEAEEYREEWQNKGYYFVSQEMEQIELDDIVNATFKDGAEFGYKLAHEEMDYLNKHWRNGKDKANEWHYVKDELPPIKKEYNGRSELVLVLSKEKEMQYAQYVEEAKTWARGIFEISFVPYAWKEIVLPELKESE